jgi:2'-5' RNA ligase
MRTFIAIELSAEIKAALNKLQEQLKTANADVKWVKPQNIHLTLKFLGEIDEKKLKMIIQILEDASGKMSSFYIRLSSLGAFPKINFPRVIWVGIDKGDKETQELAAALEEKIAKIGIPKESRPFSSHITIGRIRSALNRENLVKILGELAAQFSNQAAAEFRVTKITLFKSTLMPQGPIYEVIKEAPLKDTN